MSRFSMLRSALLVVGLVAGGSAVALAPAPAQAAVPSVGKVAMVDMQSVLNDTIAGKRARKELEASSTAKQKKLDKKRTQLEKDAAKLQSLKGAQLVAAQEKLQKESMSLQEMLFILEKDLTGEHNKLLEKMYKNAQSIVADIAKKKSIDLVLVRDQMTVIYAKDSLDITKEVVKIYNSKHK